MLAQSFQAPYRVMRCAAATGAKVFLFCNDEARSLALSRFCAGYRDFGFEPEPAPDAAAAEIESFCRAHKIDMILPADAIATRLLARTRHLLTRATRSPRPPLAEALRRDRAMTYAARRVCRGVSIGPIRRLRPSRPS